MENNSFEPPFEVKSGDVVRHFKKGGLSIILGIGKHADGPVLVNYIGLESKEIYSRPIEKFFDMGMKDGQEVPRFTKLTEDEVSGLLAQGILSQSLYESCKSISEFVINPLTKE